jgi:oxidase EvaA
MADGDIEAHEDFCWMTAGQLKALMQMNNKVNSPARSVFSLLNIGGSISMFDDTRPLADFGKALLLSAATKYSLHTIEYLLSWLTDIKSRYDLIVRPCPLNKMRQWHLQDGEIVHTDNKYFKVLGINVSIANREVSSWSQPVISPVQTYFCVFILKEINGVLHFLMQAKFECGNYDIVEMAPAVQCLTGKDGKPNGYVPFFDYAAGVKPECVLHDTTQSEEGGRFYHDQNRYMIIMADEHFPVEIPEHYVWMTLNQIYEFLRFNNFINAQARSLLAALPYI